MSRRCPEAAPYRYDLTCDHCERCDAVWKWDAKRPACPGAVTRVSLWAKLLAGFAFLAAAICEIAENDRT